MALRVLSIEQTPNPRARKITVSAPMSDRPRSFRTREEGLADPQAAPLFAIDAVEVVLISGDWLSVTLDDAKRWASAEPRVRKAIESLTTSASSAASPASPDAGP